MHKVKGHCKPKTSFSFVRESYAKALIHERIVEAEFSEGLSKRAYEVIDGSRVLFETGEDLLAMFAEVEHSNTRCP